MDVFTKDPESNFNRQISHVAKLQLLAIAERGCDLLPLALKTVALIDKLVPRRTESELTALGLTYGLFISPQILNDTDQVETLLQNAALKQMKLLTDAPNSIIRTAICDATIMFKTDIATSHIPAVIPPSVEATAVLTITEPAMKAGKVGETFGSSITATGGALPYEFAIEEGSLPDGLTLDPKTGIIAGTPTEDGMFPFEVEVIDGKGDIASTNSGISISPIAMATDTSSAPSETPKENA